MLRWLGFSHALSERHCEHADGGPVGRNKANSRGEGPAKLRTPARGAGGAPELFDEAGHI